MSYALLQAISPEILLVVAAVAIYLAGAFFAADAFWPRAAFASIVAAAAVLWLFGGASAMFPTQQSLGVAVHEDALTLFGRVLALAAGGILTLMTWRSARVAGAAEYAGSLLLVTVGAMLVAGANDLVLLFVGLELISIPTYILLYIGRVRADSQEAAVKYFFLSIMSSAILLYGLSFLYGCAGSTDLTAIRTALADTTTLPEGFRELAKLAAVLILAGLGVKVAVVPFHFYAPDVYQGTTHANAALLSVVPKAAGVIALIRLLTTALPGPESGVWQILFAVSALSMTLGNLLALWQDNLRRLLAYSSIANAGYIFIGLAVGFCNPQAAPAWNGIASALFYLVAYSAATLGVFAAFIFLGQGGAGDSSIETVDDLVGSGRSKPVPAALLTLLLLSLTGIPPLAGFWAKLLVFGGSLGAGGGWFIALAVVGAINAAIAAAYYLRIVAAIYFRSGDTAAEVSQPGGHAAGSLAPLLAVVLCAVVVLAAGLYPRLLTWPSDRAAAAVTGNLDGER